MEHLEFRWVKATKVKTLDGFDRPEERVLAAVMRIAESRAERMEQLPRARFALESIIEPCWT